jgi:hypothetical protein
MQGSHTRLPLLPLSRRRRVPVGPAGHPPTLTMRDDRVPGHLDGWMADRTVLARARRGDRVTGGGGGRQQPSRAPGCDTGQGGALRRPAETRSLPEGLGRRHGPVPRRRADGGARTRSSAAEAVLVNAPPAPPPSTGEEVMRTPTILHRVRSLLGESETGDRGQLNRTLGVALGYRRHEGWTR